MSGSDRISVLRNNQVVPLVPCSHHQPAEQPWSGLLVEHHTVSAIEIPQHVHRDLCLHLQITGNEAIEWWSTGRHGIERTAPGSMILLPPGTEDRLRWQGPSERLILSVDSGLLEQAADETQTPFPEFAARWSLHDPALQQVVLDLGRQVAEGWPLGRLYAGLSATSLVAQLLRSHTTNPATQPGIKGGLPLPQLRHTMEYITANLDRDISLDEIASQIHLSPFHFARNFRAVTGQTPYQYLLDQRMDRAKRLLKKNLAWSVQEIAAMTGFRSAASFVRAFRQRVGQTPGEWRKDH